MGVYIQQHQHFISGCLVQVNTKIKSLKKEWPHDDIDDVINVVIKDLQKNNLLPQKW